MTRRRLNDMKFCVCRHGQGAHRKNTGACSGIRRVTGGWWVACSCPAFAPEPAYEDETGTE